MLSIQQSVLGGATSVAIPTGYGFVLFNNTVPGSSVELTADSSLMALAGADMDFSGGAGTVLGTGGSVGGSITDSTAGAVIALNPSASTAAYSVSAAGAGDRVDIDSGTNFVTLGGTGDTINASGGTDTITATSGGALVVGKSTASIQFIGGGAGSTVLGTGFDNIKTGGAPLDYVDLNGGISGGRVRIANAAGGSVTAFLGASQRGVFVGGGSGSYYAQSGTTILAELSAGNATAPSSNVFYGGDTTPTILGNSNQFVSAVGTKGALALLQGHNAGLNLAQTAGSDTVEGFNELNSGSQTLVGSAAGNDTMAFVNLGTTAGATTVNVLGWQASDTFQFWAYSGADVATANNALAGASSGSVAFTLSDGTTFNFINSHPTSVQPH